MTQDGFPPLTLTEWRLARDSLHRYAKVLGAIRGALTPKQKHWWHSSLRVTPKGLSTTGIPFGTTGFKLLLDFSAHRLAVNTDRGQARYVPLAGQTLTTFGRQVLTALFDLGIPLRSDIVKLGNALPCEYDYAAVERYWCALQRIDATFKRFKSQLGSGTSPVQLWPHHFDLALTWFSGRIVPGADPENEDAADEQMTFGFSTGDDTIPDAYLYVTAYPQPPELVQMPLPPDIVWHTHDWQGAVLTYQTLVEAHRPEKKLLEYLMHVHAMGTKWMTR